MPLRPRGAAPGRGFAPVRRSARACALLGALLGAAWPGSAVVATAQRAGDSLTYAGDYRLGGRLGAARFGYRLARRDTVLDGAFAFASADAAALYRPGGDRAVRLAGAYADGAATGPWRVGVGELRASGGARLASDPDSLTYRVHVDGNELLAAGAFERGRAEGEWRLLARTVRGGAAVDTSLAARFAYAAGRPRQTFTLAEPGAELLGRVTRAGLAHDAWTLLDDRGGEEVWTFEEGVLRSVVTTGPGGARDSVPVFGILADTARVPVDGDFVRLLTWHQRLARQSDTPVRGATAALLRRYGAALSRLNVELAALPGADPPGAVEAIVPYRPLSATQRARLARIGSALAAVDEAVATADDPRRRRAALTDDSQARATALLRQLGGPYLRPVRSLDSAFRQNLLTALPLPALLEDLFPGGAVDPAVSVDDYVGPAGRDTVRYAPADATAFDVAGEGLAAVEALAEYARGVASELVGALGVVPDAPAPSESSAAPGRDAAAAADDLAAAERIAARIDSLVAATPRRLARANGIDAVAARARAETSPACLTELYALAVVLRAVPLRRQQVEEAYTDEVWNNIIATVMTERVKRRLTRAYDEVALPYLLGRVDGDEADGLACGEAGRLAGDIDALHARLLALREADTESLEDALKDERDPRRVLGLLLNATPQ